MELRRVLVGFFLTVTIVATATRAAFAAPHVAAASSAISLAALVAAQSPSLSATQKREMLDLLDDTLPAPSASPVVVRVQRIVCHVGDVNLMARGCALSFGSRSVSLTGASANALIAAMAEANVITNGAAGTVYRSLSSLACTIDFSEIRRMTGGGVNCTYTAP